MKTIIVEMPDDWMPAMCPDCHIQYSGSTGICGGSICPLAKSIKAMEVKSGFDVCWGENVAYYFHSRKPITLYAVEDTK